MNVRSAVATVGIAAAVTFGAFGVTNAEAVHNPDYCHFGAVTCAYYDAGYLNGMGYRSPGTGLADISAANRNKLSSWENLSSTGARFYYNTVNHTGGKGHCVQMYANSSNTVHPGDGNPDNDQAESWAFNGGC